jgi:hypothetical protein
VSARKTFLGLPQKQIPGCQKNISRAGPKIKNQKACISGAAQKMEDKTDKMSLPTLIIMFS